MSLAEDLDDVWVSIAIVFLGTRHRFTIYKENLLQKTMINWSKRKLDTKALSLARGILAEMQEAHPELKDNKAVRYTVVPKIEGTGLVVNLYADGPFSFKGASARIGAILEWIVPFELDCYGNKIERVKHQKEDESHETG